MSPRSRREFLQTSSAIVAGSTFTISGTKASGQIIGANERIILGAIGVGNQGRYNADTLLKHNNNAQFAAISDVYLPRAKEVATKLGAKDVYQDYRKLLERKDIDGVLIATPHHWHALNAIHAAQAGKDIYCEKPLAYTIVEGRRIVEAVRKNKCVFQTGMQQRSGVRENSGCTHLLKGSIGKIKRVVGSNFNTPMELGVYPGQTIPDGLDWDVWCGPVTPPDYHFGIWDNRSKPSWVSVRPFSGGQMCDWGAHEFDMIQWGLGMDDAGPIEVWTEGKPYSPKTSSAKSTGNRHDGVNRPKLMMKYPGDITVELADGPGGFGARFEGEYGTITVSRSKFNSSIVDLVQPLEGDPKALTEYHTENWLECIKSRRDPVANAEIGHRSTTVCHLGNIARWVSQITGVTGQKLQWDFRKERFTNSDEANKFLDRQRRKGYELPENV